MAQDSRIEKQSDANLTNLTNHVNQRYEMIQSETGRVNTGASQGAIHHRKWRSAGGKGVEECKVLSSKERPLIALCVLCASVVNSSVFVVLSLSA